VLKLCDLITIAVPPALPAALHVGISFSINRLKRKQIYCIAPSKVVIGGRVDLICFDKTGTLTEDAVLVKGIY
jgi:cation-transporting ATPase 13A3/4/5